VATHEPLHGSAVLPIFYDPRGGKRWRVIQVTILTALAVIVASLVALTVNAVHSPLGGPAGVAGVPPVRLSQLDAGRMPLFGDGVYQRIVDLERSHGRTVASDLFTGDIVHWLSPAEARAVGNARYAFERYGVLPKKQLALTFDDGPDRTWTPKILDLLARYKIQASFFLIGSEVAKDPTLTRRIVEEGHLIGNHTFTHPPGWPKGQTRDRIEMALTDRVIRATTGKATELFRNPYGGNDVKTVRQNLTSIYTAQRLGYQTLAYDLDTNDWQFETRHLKPTPLDLKDGLGHVVLLHDGGGDRTLTYAYLERTIKQARQMGYVFTTPRWIADDAKDVYRSVRPSLTDRATLFVAQGVFRWVDFTLTLLFFLGVAGLFGLSTLNICLACVHERRVRRQPIPLHVGPVTVAIAAYNEEDVIERTVRSVLRSTGVDLEVLVVDDGSKDSTRDILEQLRRSDPRVRVFHIPNGGKGNALNLAFRKSSYERIVTFDADTVVPPDTVARLVRHFRQRRVAGVAGLVKVGNVRGVLTAWQSLEYISSIGVERTAQSVLGTITVVPGACAAWRRSRVRAVGGFTTDTLAEDCDLTLKLQRAGCRIIQDNTALAFTEAPQGLRPLLKQRFRWSFGNLQALWKHRTMMFRWRHGFLGMFVLPYTFVSLALPIIFLPLLYTALATSAMGGGYQIILVFAAVFTVGQGMICLFGLLITRSSLRHLFVVPVFRIISEPLRIYLLYKSIFAAMKGRAQGWNKLPRTGTVTLEPPIGAEIAAQAGEVLGALMPSEPRRVPAE
jgi:cellulose synthase/poly-beta-1,6-N-acetylglucosamine synthase-like glycosyltransferase/peptidoglycan/xylan/chitin deacetylase (PgdA/CDA1 family)